MAIAQANPVIRYARQLAVAHLATALPDAQLLERYAYQRDQAAFAALVRRHGPLVLGACRRVLHDVYAADDAFQTTFIVLARKANSLRHPAALGPWLYGVATRTALKLRGRDARRRVAERQAAVGIRTEPLDGLVWRDLRPVLDEAIASLPDHYRMPFVLHHLEGATVAEVARQLGCPQGTVAARLARAKERLRGRLAHKGLAVSVAGLLALLSKNVASAGVPAPLLVSTTRAAAVAAGQEMAVGVGPATVAALAQGGIKAMFMTKVKVVAAVFLLAGAGGGFSLFGQPAAPGVQAGITNGGGVGPAAQDKAPKAKKGRAVAATDGNTNMPILPPLPPDGRPNVENPPDSGTILRLLPPIKRGVPYIYQESRDDYDITVERLVDRLDPPRFFPMVGPAQLRHLHYKCTVYYTETIASSYPFPFQCQRRRSCTVFIDRDQLYLVNTAMEKITNQQAEKDFQIAEFYRRTGHRASALFHYEIVRRRYPGTTFAEKATERLREPFQGSRVLATVNGQAILVEEVYAAACLTIPEAHTLTGLERAWRLAAIWKETLDRLVEREVVLQNALGTLETRSPKILAKLQEAASREFDRQWVQPAKKNAALKDDENLKAALRAQGTSLESVRRQWQRDFLAREYRRSRVSPRVNPGATSLDEATRQEWRQIVANLKRAAVIEYTEGR